MPKPYPKKGMPPKKAKKPLKRTAIKKKYGTNKKCKSDNEGVSQAKQETKKILYGKTNKSISKTRKELDKKGLDAKIPANKRPNGLKRNSIKKRVKKTGEMDVFFELVKEHGDETIYCKCCNKPLYSLSPINFSHVVPKSLSNRLRLDKRNIWIVCELCHTDWDAGDRNQPKFSEKRKLFEQLRIEDNANNR